LRVDISLDDNKAGFVTTLPTDFTVTPKQDVYANLMIDGSSTGLLYFENDNGDVFSRAVTDTDLLSQHRIAGDLTGLTLVSGTAPLVKSDTEYYTVKICRRYNHYSLSYLYNTIRQTL